jgi:hypothetical protein
MKIDLKDIANGVLNAQILQKIEEQLIEENNGAQSNGLTIVVNEKEIVIPKSNTTNTLILLEILEHVKKIDANVEKLINKTN